MDYILYDKIDTRTGKRDIYKGSHKFETAFKDGEMILGVAYEDHNYLYDYFTIESLEDGNALSFSHTMINGTAANQIIIYISKNDSSWTQYNYTDPVTQISLNSGDNVKIKIDATGISEYTNPSNVDPLVISTTKKTNVYGNIMSLLYGDNFASQTTLFNNAGIVLGRLFHNSTNLINAKNLILPATTLTTRCYSYPSYKLQDYIGGMFYGCSSLVSAPELPATTLAQRCYESMFYGCSSLISAPELPATTLTNNCYKEMFYGCSSLEYVKCLSLSDMSASSGGSNLYVSNWLRNVSASGTFAKASGNTTWLTGNSGIPSGWTVQDV